MQRSLHSGRGRHARGATLYVTLEPCAHQGRTGPCVDAIAAAGVSRVVIGLADPDPIVNGKGIEQLHAGDIRSMSVSPSGRPRSWRRT